MTAPLVAGGASVLGLLATAVGFVTALLAVFVAYQGYRGYRRNDSAPVFFLSLGILFLTALPFFASEALGTLPGVSDAKVILAIQVLNVVGLGSVLYALTRA